MQTRSKLKTAKVTLPCHYSGNPNMEPFWKDVTLVIDTDVVGHLADVKLAKTFNGEGYSSFSIYNFDSVGCRALGVQLYGITYKNRRRFVTHTNDYTRKNFKPSKFQPARKDFFFCDK